MSAQVIQLPRRDGHDPELTYVQLAELIAKRRRSDTAETCDRFAERPPGRRAGAARRPEMA